MSGEKTDVEAERRQLMGLAFRMLGTLADAEDAVQETYVRWYRMSAHERDDVRSPGAWLMRTASRVCLDMLGSARARRERYVGEWLPEPVPAGDLFPAVAGVDPLDRVSLDDDVSTALLVVLETLTPAERVAFVLHDVFGMAFADIAATVGRSPDAARQLASAARRRIRERRARAASPQQHDALVQAFAQACETGRLEAVVRVLDPGVVLRSDGGGVVSAARRPVVGADRVARFVLGLAERHPDAHIEPAPTADGLGFVVTLAGRLHSVWTFGASADGVSEVRVMLNPAKLTAWT